VISNTKPTTVPEKLRNFKPKIEDCIKDAPIKLSILLLKSTELEEWYYAKDEEIKIRLKILQDTTYFNPKALF